MARGFAVLVLVFVVITTRATVTDSQLFPTDVFGSLTIPTHINVAAARPMTCGHPRSGMTSYNPYDDPTTSLPCSYMCEDTFDGTFKTTPRIRFMNSDGTVRFNEEGCSGFAGANDITQSSGAENDFNFIIGEENFCGIQDFIISSEYNWFTDGSTHTLSVQLKDGRSVG